MFCKNKTAYILSLIAALVCNHVSAQDLNKPSQSIPTLAVFPNVLIRELGENSRSFEIDSSQMSKIDSTWFNELPNNDEDSESKELHVFGSKLICKKNQTQDFSGLVGTRLPVGFGGVLGIDFLESTDVAFDPLEQKFYIGKLKDIEADQAVSIPLEYSAQNDPEKSVVPPSAVLTFGKNVTCKAEVLLAQNRSLTLTKDLFDLLLARGMISTKEFELSTETTQELQLPRVGRLKHFNIGSIELTNVVCGEGPSNQIGMLLLRRFFVGLSLKDKVLLLKLQKDIPWDHSGHDGIQFKVKFTPLKTVLLIKNVRKGSLADSAGLKAGDEIIQADSVPGSKYQVIAERIVIRDKPILVQIVRNSVPMEIEIPIAPTVDAFSK